MAYPDETGSVFSFSQNPLSRCPFCPHFLSSSHTEFRFAFSAHHSIFLFPSLCIFLLLPGNFLTSLTITSSFRFHFQIPLREIFSYLQNQIWSSFYIIPQCPILLHRSIPPVSVFTLISHFSFLQFHSIACCDQRQPGNALQ